MRWLLTLTALTVASVAFAQCPNGQCAPVQASVTYRFTAPPPPTVTYTLPAPRVEYTIPAAPVVRYTYAAPAYYVPAAPVYAAPVYLVRPERRYSTPLRDFFFGK